MKPEVLSILHTGEGVHRKTLKSKHREFCRSFSAIKNTGPEQIIDETQGQCFRHRALKGKKNIVEPGFDPTKYDIGENSPVKIDNYRGSSSFFWKVQKTLPRPIFDNFDRSCCREKPLEDIQQIFLQDVVLRKGGWCVSENDNLRNKKKVNLKRWEWLTRLVIF